MILNCIVSLCKDESYSVNDNSNLSVFYLFGFCWLFEMCICIHTCVCCSYMNMVSRNQYFLVFQITLLGNGLSGQFVCISLLVADLLYMNSVGLMTMNFYSLTLQIWRCRWLTLLAFGSHYCTYNEGFICINKSYGFF